MLKNKSNVQMLLQTLETWVPNLSKENEPLVNISTGERASDKLFENFETRYVRNEFILHITTNKKHTVRKNFQKKFYDQTKRQNLFCFGSNWKKRNLLTTTKDKKLQRKISSTFENENFIANTPYSICDKNKQTPSNP